MLMSVIARSYESVAVPDIAGARVLITGLTSASGFDIARAFSDHGARLIVQSPEESPEMTELAAVLAENSTELRLFNTALECEADATRLVQAAAADFGGLDMVVNLVPLTAAAVRPLETCGDVEALISDSLRLPLRMTEVAANRMRLVWSEGSILNVVRFEEAVTGGRGMMLAAVLRAELADLTRGLAQEWAEHGISVNAVAPPSVTVLGGDAQASDADLAAVALQLASRKGSGISGHVLDAAGAARRWC